MINAIWEWLFGPSLKRQRALAYAVRMEYLARVSLKGGDRRVAWAAIKKGNEALDSIK